SCPSQEFSPSADLLAQEFQRAFAGKTRTRLVPGLVAEAIEGVTGADIDVDRDTGGLERHLDLLGISQRDARILIAEMEHDRAARLLVEIVDDGAAIVPDRGGEAGNARGRQPRHRAAHAETNNADFAGPFQGTEGRGDIEKHVVGRDRLTKGAAGVDAILVIIELNIPLGAIEDRRGEHMITTGGIAIGNPLAMRIDAEDLLNDDKTAAWLARRLCFIGAEGMPIPRRQLDEFAHLVLLSRLQCAD